MTIRPHNTPDNSRRPTAARYSRKTRRGAAGFSLLEVILALGILGGAVAVLGEVARNAMENARYARDLTIAELLCETKMAEITSGITVAEVVVDEPLDTTDDPDAIDWLHSIDVETLDDETGLSVVTVTVVKDVPTEKHPASVSLTRWFIDSSSATSTESSDATEETETSVE